MRSLRRSRSACRLLGNLICNARAGVPAARPAAALTEYSRDAVSEAAWLPTHQGSSSLLHATPLRLQSHRPGGNHFRPFSTEDEAQLVAVLSSKPRHVARYIRQSMQHSRKRIAQFRNSVTYLMILLQSKLQRKELDPADATAIVESVMRECVELRQSDIAHLLFRASLRFRKYGLVVTYAFVKHLFDSYRNDNARDLMRSLAEELKGDDTLKPLALTAYLFAGMPLEANGILETMDVSLLQTGDFCAIIEGYGVVGEHEQILRLVNRVVEGEDTTFAHVDIAKVLSMGVAVSHKSHVVQYSLVQCAQKNSIPLLENALGALIRGELKSAKSVNEVYEVEAALKEKLGVRSLGMQADTAIIGKCSELVSRGQARGDHMMQSKLEHLKSIVEASIDGDSIDSLDATLVLSLIKGYGVLGKMDEVKLVFERLRDANALKDHRVYDEMLKWYAYTYNVKEVIALKEEMTARHIYHTAYTYHNVFRVLDKYYPRMVGKYLNEMRSKGMHVESFMYPTLLRVFSELDDRVAVEQLYREVRAKASAGDLAYYTPVIVIQLLKIFAADPERCEEVIRNAENYGLLSNEALQAELVQYYCINNRDADVRRLVSRLPYKSAHMYRVLLRNAAMKRNRSEFDSLLEDIRNEGVVLGERLCSVILTAFSHFNDLEGVKRYVSEAVLSNSCCSPLFFSDAAAAFARLGDFASVDACWKDLLETKMTITMPVFNKFLDLYMAMNNMDMVQQILNAMMKLVPPNPVTATTVVDMLGKMGRLTEMEAVLSEMRQSANAAPTVVTYHQVMNAYAKCGDVVKMERARTTMKEEGFQENHVTFNILAEGYGRAKRFEHLQELLEERKKKGIQMEEYGYVILLNIYARARMAKETTDTVNEMVKSGIVLSSRMLATIATAYSLIGDVDQMEHYISAMLAQPGLRQRDIESVYLLYSRIRDVVKLQEMLDNPNLPKTETMYNVCVAAFARAGEHTKVSMLLQEMDARGFTLTRSTSVTLSSLLLKSGKLELAQMVLRWKGIGGVSAGQPSSESVGSDRVPADGVPNLVPPSRAAEFPSITEGSSGVDEDEDELIQRHLSHEVADEQDGVTLRKADFGDRQRAAPTSV